jgi:serine/threonine-protein kinase
MDAQRWQRVAELYELAYARKPEERQGFLREACAGDNGLLGEVLDLLQQDVSRTGILEKIAAMAAEDFSGTERFRVLRRLGAGGMGVVYEA